MRNRLLCSAFFAVFVIAATAATAIAQTCVVVDEAHDTLTKDERIASRLLLAKQLELAGQHVVDRDCAGTYTVSHIRLGTTIMVSLSGPLGTREATALGLDDLPAVYSQMVRSLITGQPVGSAAVVDRSNVMASQDASPRRVRGEGYWYARLGQASLFGPKTESGAGFGFGYRAQFDRFGLDVSFLNFQVDSPGSYTSGRSSAASLIKMQGIMLTNPTGNRSAYFGGGLSFGRAEISSAYGPEPPTSGRGSGLQGDLTAGYEIARATSARIFVQADVTLPFYSVLFESFSYEPPVNGRYTAPTVTTSRRYVPSLAVSIGVGWHRR